jgi:hypothetical protein
MAPPPREATGYPLDGCLSILSLENPLTSLPGCNIRKTDFGRPEQKDVQASGYIYRIDSGPPQVKQGEPRDSQSGRH